MNGLAIPMIEEPSNTQLKLLLYNNNVLLINLYTLSYTYSQYNQYSPNSH